MSVGVLPLTHVGVHPREHFPAIAVNRTKLQYPTARMNVAPNGFASRKHISLSKLINDQSTENCMLKR